MGRKELNQNKQKILHDWSFQMKFIKQALAIFLKFYMRLSLV